MIIFDLYSSETEYFSVKMEFGELKAEAYSSLSMRNTIQLMLMLYTKYLKHDEVNLYFLGNRMK